MEHYRPDAPLIETVMASSLNSQSQSQPQLPLPFPVSRTLNPKSPFSTTKPKKRSPVSSSSLPQKLVSLSLSPPTHLLPPRIPGNNLSDITAFLVFVSAAAVGVLKLGRGRRPPPPLHRSIAPPRPSTSNDEFRVVHRVNDVPLGFADFYSRLEESEAAIGRRRSFRLMLLARGSYRHQSEATGRFVSGRNASHLARIQVPLVMPIFDFREFEVLMPGKLHLRNNVVKAEEHEDLVDISLEPTGVDVEHRDNDNCDVSNVNDSSSTGGQLLLPEICPSTLDFPSSSNVEKENLQYQSELQRAIPELAMLAGVWGVFIAGESGGLEMVGFMALTSFVVYDILWASKRRMLWAELAQITDREKFVGFLLSRRIIVENNYNV